MWIRLEIIFGVIVTVFLIMEVIIPALMNKKLFPSFRSKSQKEKDFMELVNDVKNRADKDEKLSEDAIAKAEALAKEEKEKLEKIQDIKSKL